jgi:predicted kinase
MFQQACGALGQQHLVVVDATFSLRQYRAPYLNFSKEHRIPLKVIMVTADENSIFQRLQHSRPDSDADFKVYQKIKAEFEPIDMEYLKLESDQYSLDTMLERGISYLVPTTS